MLEKSFQNYDGNDLGAIYTADSTSFRIWAPTAEGVKLYLYKDGDMSAAYDTRDMQKDEKGTWYLALNGDFSGVYYCYEVTVDGVSRITNDPYAKACGVNGRRSMVIDLASTNPEGFDSDCGPVVEHVTDLVICEVSVADTTADSSCGSKYPGKYLGMAEVGTKNKTGEWTGLSHYVDLGVTHLQIMPCYDFGSIDEAQTNKEQYNWGYDPVNYNVPEGSYATDSFSGEVRIKEFKQMVQGIHKAGLGVIMDVVYNHTYDALDSCFEKVVPGYYYRMDGDKFSDASACGNEIASEKPMMRKYLVESVCYWMKEYHIDGFRFDLMGVLDIDTMNAISQAARTINPNVVIYGEGWTGGDSTLPFAQRAMKVNLSKLDHVGAFSDDMRDGVKGHVFYDKQTGFVNGGQNKENDIRFSVVGAVKHEGVDYKKYEYTLEGAYAKSPEDVINYVSCHDNLTLWDKLFVSCPFADKEERLSMNRLAASIVFTSQGVPFFLSGEEFARTKPIQNSDLVSENSYNLPLYTNSLKYDRLHEYRELNAFYKGLISLRKKFKEFRMYSADEVQNNLVFVENLYANVVAFMLHSKERTILVAYNANPQDKMLVLPEGEWEVYLNGKEISNQPLKKVNHQTMVKPISCLVAVCEKQ